MACINASFPPLLSVNIELRGGVGERWRMLNGNNKKLALKVCQILVEKVEFEEGRKECLNMGTFEYCGDRASVDFKVATKGEKRNG